jgi:hypothetical protein
MVMKLQVPKYVGEYLSICATCGFSRKAQLHGIRLTEFLDFFPSSGILETRKHNVSETGSVSVLR